MRIFQRQQKRQRDQRADPFDLRQQYDFDGDAENPGILQPCSAA